MDSIIKLETIGYKFTLDNDYIKVDFVSGSIPNVEEVKQLLEDIENNKDAAIRFIKHKEIEEMKRAAAEKGYFTDGECYAKQLTLNSFAFIHKLDDLSKWTGYRRTYDDFNNVVSDKTIIENTDFIKVLNRVETYINNYINFINKARA